MEKNAAVQFMEKISNITPEGLWKFIDMVRSNKLPVTDKNNNKLLWPKNVFLPLVIYDDIIMGYRAITMRKCNSDEIYNDFNELDKYICEVQSLSVISQWRLTQDIVHFDRDAYDSIVNTPITGELPCEILNQLPTWCIYVEMYDINIGNIDILGFFAMYDYNYDLNCVCLDIVFLTSELKLISTLYFSLNGGTIIDSLMSIVNKKNSLGFPDVFIKQADGDVPGSYYNALTEFIKIDNINKVMNAILYICANGLPKNHKEEHLNKLIHKKYCSNKKGWRLFPAQRPTYHTIGTEIGEAIRAYKAKQKSDKPRADMRPHVRRAHWHGYWSGSRKEEVRNYTLHWLPPIPVAMKDDSDDVVA